MRHYPISTPVTRVRELETLATKFLRKHGYRGDGLKWGSVDLGQRRFEARAMIKSPTGGQRDIRPR